jgi:hypothetical protein
MQYAHMCLIANRGMDMFICLLRGSVDEIAYETLTNVQTQYLILIRKYVTLNRESNKKRTLTGEETSTLLAKS